MSMRPPTTKPFLGYAAASRVADAARSVAEAESVAVAICVVDDAGNVVRFDRLDNCLGIASRAAKGKARTAVEMRVSTEQVEHLAQQMPTLIAIPGIFPFRGGVPLFDGVEVVGAIGVSGGSPEQDAHIADVGAQALLPSPE